MTSSNLTARCCVVGGGPAGMMLGLLLARAGIDVVVLEKHADFLRDFRGDTVHPSTLELMHELGLLDSFLARPHQQLAKVGAQIGDTFLPVADFSRLPTHCKFIALMPQWDFLNFLAQEAQRSPRFRLLMRTAATGLLRDGSRICGVTAESPDGAAEIRAELVVACDGRHSTLRAAAALPVIERGAPIDVLWLRLSRHDSDPGQTLGHVDAGRFFITLDRGDYWQCAFVIPKGGFEALRSAGLPAFLQDLAAIAPYLRDRLGEIASWDDVKLLSVAVNRLPKWYLPGLLCIGDAAHAMSPIGGVGINLAVQDAVATANRLVPRLRAGQVREEDLKAVQGRREMPTRLTQAVQVAIQNRVLGPVLQAETRLRPPAPLRLVSRSPVLRGLLARVIGMGFRPEHIRH